jgi:nicotinic acid mononucleotide adenylyltransferase
MLESHDIAEILLKLALNTKNQNYIKGVIRSLRKKDNTMTKRTINHLQNTTQARTHAVLVIGLYELLGNPTT